MLVWIRFHLKRAPTGLSHLIVFWHCSYLKSLQKEMQKRAMATYPLTSRFLVIHELIISPIEKNHYSGSPLRRGYLSPFTLRPRGGQEKPACHFLPVILRNF